MRKGDFVYNDFLLIRKMKQGDDNAFDLFVHKYYQEILSYCYHHCFDQTYAEDLTQETFIRFFTKLSDYHYKGKTLNYLYTIFISTRKCCFYAVFRYLSSDLLHFYSNFKPIFSVQLLLLFSFLLKRACINRLSLPMWNDLRVSALPVGLLHFHNTL